MKRYAPFGILTFVALLALFGLLAAPALTQAQSSTQEVSMTLSEFAISPSNVTFTQGQAIHFSVTNTGKFPHNVTFMKDGKILDVFAAPLKGGQSGTADFTFGEAGNWDMYCPVGNHAAKGMVGQALVLSASTPGMPSTGHADEGLLLAAGIFGMALLGSGLAARRLMAKRSL